MSDLGNRQIIAENIQYYMAQNHVTATELCKSLGFKMPTFSDWIHAKTYPRIDKIEAMANYFGISKADLVERRGSIPALSDAQLKAAFFNGYDDDLSHEEIDALWNDARDYLQYKLSQRKKRKE